MTRGMVKEDFHEPCLAISSLQIFRSFSLNHGTGYDLKNLILQGSMTKKQHCQA